MLLNRFPQISLKALPISREAYRLILFLYIPHLEMVGHSLYSRFTDSWLSRGGGAGFHPTCYAINQLQLTWNRSGKSFYNLDHLAVYIQILFRGSRKRFPNNKLFMELYWVNIFSSNQNKSTNTKPFEINTVKGNLDRIIKQCKLSKACAFF